MTPQSSITMVAEGRRRMSPSWAYNWIRFTTSIPSTTSPVNTASTFSDDTTGAMSGVFSGTLSVIRELTERYVPPIKPRCSSGCNKILCKEMRGQQRCCDCGRSNEAIETKLRQLNDGMTTREPAKIGADQVKRSGAVNWSCADKVASR